MRKCTAVIAGLILITSLRAVADEAGMRAYDVRDLLIEIPESTELVSGPREVVPADELKAKTDARVAATIVAVRAAMPKASGAAAEFKYLGGQLFVTADAAGQTATAKMLDTARTARARQVIVSTKALRISDDEFANLDDDLRGRIMAATLDTLHQPIEVSEADVKQLKRVCTLLIAAPRVTNFSGSAARIEMAFPGPDGVIALDVKAVTAADGASVAVMVKVQQGSLADAAKTLSGTYSDKPGKQFLFIPPAEANDAGGRRLMAIVQATPIIQREVSAADAK